MRLGDDEQRDNPLEFGWGDEYQQGDLQIQDLTDFETEDDLSGIFDSELNTPEDEQREAELDEFFSSASDIESLLWYLGDLE